MKTLRHKLRMVFSADGKITTVRSQRDGNGRIVNLPQRYDSKLGQWVAAVSVKPASVATTAKATKTTKTKPKPAAVHRPKNKVLEAFRAEFGFRKGSVLYCDSGPSPTMADFDRELKTAKARRQEENELAEIAKLPIREQYSALLGRKIRLLQKR